MAVVRFDHVDVVFGDDPKAALALLDAGEGRDSIQEKTGNVVAVHDADMAVEQGEICVLMGLSGSGKSTLLRAVNGLNTVTRGRVLVRDGDKMADVASCDSGTLRRIRSTRVAMVFQQFALLPWRSVRDNVGFGLELRGMDKAERDAVVMDKLQMVGLDQLADKFPYELSGGMQQRVGLARAFATDAEILLMDEPFSALDPLIRAHLQDELLDLQRRLNKSILFVSHDLDEALKLGSHIAIMESGRIVQNGDPVDIVTRPANEYVRRFVANMNPLNVLRGDTLMRPAAQLDRAADDGAVLLDHDGLYRVVLDGDGRPADVKVNGHVARLVPWRDDLDLSTVAPGDLVTGAPDTPMRVAIEVNHTLNRPMPLTGSDGRLVGVVGANEIFAGMLRQLGDNARDPDRSP
jgi:glycine betaine/proline transport system ATP-binding protein